MLVLSSVSSRLNKNKRRIMTGAEAPPSDVQRAVRRPPAVPTKHDLVWPLIDPSVLGNHASGSTDATTNDEQQGLLPYIHPARRIVAEKGFDVLLDLLDAEIKQGTMRFTEANYAAPDNVSYNENDKISADHSVESSLRLYVYTPKCEQKSAWSPACLIARGLILDIKNKKLVATPFWKFFNDFEDEKSLDKALDMAARSNAACSSGAGSSDSTESSDSAGGSGCGVSGSSVGGVRVSEKMDGSLGIVFFHAQKWRVATKGSFHSPQAVFGAAYLEEHFDTSRLVKGTTYLGELIYPANRIVIPYGEEQRGITWLAAFHESGREYGLDRLRAEIMAAVKVGGRVEDGGGGGSSGGRGGPPAGAGGDGVHQVVKFAGQRAFQTLSELKHSADALPWTSEGFVVLLEGLGFRAKLKGKNYLEVHKIKSQITPHGIWTCVRGLLFDRAGAKSTKEGGFNTKNEESTINTFDEELAVDYYVLKTKTVENYVRQLVLLAAVRKVLTGTKFKELSGKDLGKLRKELEGLFFRRKSSDVSHRFASLSNEFSSAPSGSAENFVCEVFKQWEQELHQTVPHGSCPTVGQEQLGTGVALRPEFSRYPAVVHESIKKAGKLLPEDPELVEKVEEALASSDSLGGEIPGGAIELIWLAFFWCVGDAVGNDGKVGETKTSEEDPMSWLKTRDRVKLFDRVKPAAGSAEGERKRWGE